jgi:peptide/nickel transport system ATP-binding protein
MQLLEVDNLKMYYELIGNRYVRAVDDDSLSLERGASLGIVGESGCGKSSLAITIMRLLPSNAKVMNGQIKLDGRDILTMPESKLRRDIRWKRISMVFQGAMNVLNPVLKIGDQVAEAILAHENITKKEAWERTKELLSLVGIDPSRARNYPHEFSGGMRQRTVIATALSSNPDIVIADEPTTALDLIVQAQILKLLKDLKERLGLSLILISHDVSIISEMSDNVAVMYAGRIVEYGNSMDVFLNPLHPYTVSLLAAVPSVKGKRQRLESVRGVPPNLADLPEGCKFAPRCTYAKPECLLPEPQLEKEEGDHYVRCYGITRGWIDYDRTVNKC